MDTDDRLDLRSGHPWHSLWRRGVRAGIAAASINTALYFGGVLTGVFSTMAPTLGNAHEPGAGAIVAASILASVTATALYRILVVRIARPMPGVALITILILLLSFLAPAAVASWSARQIAILDVMHIVVAAATLAGLAAWDHDASMWPAGFEAQCGENTANHGGPFS